MLIRKSTIFLVFVALSGISLAAVLFVYPIRSAAHYQDILDKKKALAHTLDLTDLCLFTEARYIRHLSQADLHSAFQDHPLALEHFPSGSIILPPGHLVDPVDSGRWRERHGDAETRGRGEETGLPGKAEGGDGPKGIR